MTKWKKRLIIIGILILAWVFLRLWFHSEIRIKHFVNSNERNLQEIALTYLSGEKIPSSSERDYYKSVEIWGVQSGEHPVVKFFYSGKGIVPSGVYYGFYYSPDNVPAAILDEGRMLKPSGKEEWMWSGDGDNGGLTKRIMENWFYFESWF